MTNNQPKPDEGHHTPSRRDKLRPAELLGISAIAAAFAGGVIAFMFHNEWFRLVPIVSGIVFIVSLLGFALLGLAMKPNAEDIEARKDLRDPSEDGADPHPNRGDDDSAPRRGDTGLV